MHRLILSGGTVVLPDALLQPASVVVENDTIVAVGLDHRIGSLAVGKQADLAVVAASGPAPVVEMTLRAGVPCFRTQPAPARRPPDDTPATPLYDDGIVARA